MPWDLQAWGSAWHLPICSLALDVMVLCWLIRPDGLAPAAVLRVESSQEDPPLKCKPASMLHHRTSDLRIVPMHAIEASLDPGSAQAQERQMQQDVPALL